MRRLPQEDSELEATLGYIARPCNKKSVVFFYTHILVFILYEMVIPFLKIYPTKMHSYVYQKIYARMFTAELP